MTQPTDQQRIALTQRPGRTACMYQRWQELAFIHWRMDAQAVQEKLPPGLTVDQYDNSAWVGLVPFRMRSIRPRGLPALPWLSYFLEMNVRTYVFDQHGRPGVWFFSLDCNQPIAVRIARRFFYLPYFDAKMQETISDDGSSHYQVQRKGHAAASLNYRLGIPVAAPQIGSLEYFLLERYLLFSWDSTRQQLWTGQVHHTPYPPCELELAEWTTLPIQQVGLPVPQSPPDHKIASRGVQVEVFWLQQLESSASNS